MGIGSKFTQWLGQVGKAVFEGQAHFVDEGRGCRHCDRSEHFHGGCANIQQPLQLCFCFLFRIECLHSSSIPDRSRLLTLFSPFSAIPLLVLFYAFLHMVFYLFISWLMWGRGCPLFINSLNHQQAPRQSAKWEGGRQAGLFWEHFQPWL